MKLKDQERAAVDTTAGKSHDGQKRDRKATSVSCPLPTNAVLDQSPDSCNADTSSDFMSGSKTLQLVFFGGKLTLPAAYERAYTLSQGARFVFSGRLPCQQKPPEVTLCRCKNFLLTLEGFLQCAHIGCTENNHRVLYQCLTSLNQSSNGVLSIWPRWMLLESDAGKSIAGMSQHMPCSLQLTQATLSMQLRTRELFASMRSVVSLCWHPMPGRLNHLWPSASLALQSRKAHEPQPLTTQRVEEGGQPKQVDKRADAVCLQCQAAAHSPTFCLHA